MGEKPVIVLFVAAVTAGIISGYVTRVGARGGITSVGLVRGGLGAASTIATFALIIGGFFLLRWYWPLIAILIGSFAAAALVNRQTWPMLFAVQPAIDAAVVGATIIYWVFSN